MNTSNESQVSARCPPSPPHRVACRSYGPRMKRNRSGSHGASHGEPDTGMLGDSEDDSIDSHLPARGHPDALPDRETAPQWKRRTRPQHRAPWAHPDDPAHRDARGLARAVQGAVGEPGQDRAEQCGNDAHVGSLVSIVLLCSRERTGTDGHLPLRSFSVSVCRYEMLVRSLNRRSGFS